MAEFVILGERQKKNLQVLQDLAVSTHNFRVDGGSKDGQDVMPGVGVSTNTSPDADNVYGASTHTF
jgi:hypothetical protein